MRTSDFIGKMINVDRNSPDYWAEDFEGKYYGFSNDANHAVYEVYLSDYSREYVEKTGHNFFSLVIFIDRDDRIAGIDRVAHWHGCDDGSDDLVPKFCASLEMEAEGVLKGLIINLD